ncbi:MAG: AbrB/MazE/SpoVT family DNA-binding domain-containing protein [Phycisphaerae bacterium]
MRTRIVKIGNSRGVRLPKAVLEASGIDREVELIAEPDCVVIRSARVAREGWEEQFRQMARSGDDRLPDGHTSHPTRWDEQGWKW